MNLAVLGLGFMGTTHLRALRQVSGARLAGVLTSDPRKLADLQPGVARYERLEDVVADPHIDAVDICLPTHLHANVTLEALRAGKHVLVEKPMALDGESADRMAAEAQRQSRILMIAHVLRFWPAYVGLREAVRGRRLGAVRHARFARRSGVPRWGPWLLDPALSGGGVFDLLIHDADMCLQLFGKPAEVAAVRYSGTGAAADLLDADLYYPDLVAHISGGWHPGAEFPFSMEYTVAFEEATADFSSAGRRATLYAAEGPPQPLEGDAEPGADGPYAAQIRYFTECCQTGRAPELCPPHESADAVKLTLSLLEASRRNGEKIACRI